jgi:hypothetical protein
MDPGVRRDDGDRADGASAWIPAFAGMTVQKRRPGRSRAFCLADEGQE